MHSDRLFKALFRGLALLTLFIIATIPRFESPALTETQLLTKYWLAYVIGVLLALVFWWASTTGEKNEN